MTIEISELAPEHFGSHRKMFIQDTLLKHVPAFSANRVSTASKSLLHQGLSAI